jgi:outer membrane protein W
MTANVGSNLKRDSPMNNLKLILTFSSLFLLSVHAFGNYNTYTSSPITIDGVPNEERRNHNNSNSFKKRRRRLEKRNEKMISNEIENIRWKEEKKLTRKLKKAFHKMDKNKEMFFPVSFGHSSDSQDQTSTRPFWNRHNVMKFSPYFGISHLKGPVGEFQSDMAIGGSLETAISPFISINIGVNYFNVNLPDAIDTHNWNDYQGTKLSKLGLEIGPKIFILTRNNLRPYLGIGIGLNQMSIKKDHTVDERGFFGNSQKESFDSLFWGLRLGTEYYFSKTMGLNAFVKYSWQQSDTTGSPNSELRSHINLVKKAKMRSINFGMIILL